VHVTLVQCSPKLIGEVLKKLYVRGTNVPNRGADMSQSQRKTSRVLFTLDLFHKAISRQILLYGNTEAVT
jgi:hypothetical protein